MNVPRPILKWLVHLTGFRPSRNLDRSLRFSRETQSSLLKSFLQRNRETRFGKRFRFSGIRSIDEFQKQVPLQDYQSLAEDIAAVRNGERDVLFPSRDALHMFGLTSGSTGAPKTIPITNRYLRRFRETYGIWSTRILRDHPKLAEGKYLAMYSDWRESYTPRGVPCGAVTGLLASLQPPWIRKRMVVPAEVAGIKDPTVKEMVALHHALCHDTVLWTSANPSTLLRLADRLEDQLESLMKGLFDGAFPLLEDLSKRYRSHPDFRPNPIRARLLDRRIEEAGNTLPAAIWPGLEALSCWMGGTLTPYLEALRVRFPGVPIRDPGLMASEGRFTIPIEDNTASGIPDLNSLFFEFYPAEGSDSVPVGSTGSLLLPHEVEIGQRYYLIFTCDWGLHRYHIDDIVEVTGKMGETPLIRFVRKGSGFSSITGEKLSEDQIVVAIESLPTAFRRKRNDMMVAPIWGNPPRYILFVEGGGDLSGAECLLAAESMEKTLRELNCEYDAKRASHRLDALQAALLEPGAFDRLKREEIERAGGRAEQYKLKRIRGDLEFAERLAPYRIVATEWRVR